MGSSRTNQTIDGGKRTPGRGHHAPPSVSDLYVHRKDATCKKRWQFRLKPVKQIGAPIRVGNALHTFAQLTEGQHTEV